MKFSDFSINYINIKISAGIFLTLLGMGPVPVPLGKIATDCSQLGIFTIW